MATNTTTHDPHIRVGLGLLPDDVKQIALLKKRLSKTLDGKVTTVRVIRAALRSLEMETR